MKVGERWLKLAVPPGIFLIVLLPRILGLDVFLTADEDDQIMFANHFLKSALQGDWAGALVLGYPGVPTLILGALGVAARYLVHYLGWLPLPWVAADLPATLEQVTTHFGMFEYPLDFLLWVRVPMAVVAALGIWGIYFLTKRLLDERLALLGTLIIAFDPFILAHTRVIHVDGPLAYFMALSFLAFLLYLDRGQWRWLLLSGLFGGLAGLSKTPAALLGPILLISGLSYALFPPPGTPHSVRWLRLGLALLGWGLVAAAAFFALWPSMWSRPLFALDWIIRNIRSVNQTAHPTTGIFWGYNQTDQNPLYYLIVFPYHLTPLTTFGVVAGLAMVVTGLAARLRRRGDSLSARLLPLALGLAAYIVIFAAPVSAISRRGDRYILPVYFAAGLLSALACWWLAKVVYRGLPWLFDRLKVGPTAVVGLGILVQTLFVLQYHPYYLAYFNPLLGSYQTAPYRINIGWGEGLDLAARYLNEHTGDPKPQVAAWYSQQFAPYYSGQTVDLSNESAALTSEYTVFYINQVQRGFPSGEILSYFWQRQPLAVIKLGGIDYAWIYAGPVVSQTPPQDYQFAVNTVLGGGVRLVGLDAPQTTMPVDAYYLSPEEIESTFTSPYAKVTGGLPVTLYWETLAQINGEHNVYIRLVDEQGVAWGQVDRMILTGIWRPDRWRAGYYLRDEYKLPIDPATPPGVYHFEVGMYDFVTGQSYGVAKNIGRITLTPPNAIPPQDELNLETRLSVPVNDALVLLGHNFVDRQAPPGDRIVGKVFWQAGRRNERDYRVEFALQGPAQEKYVVAEAPLSEIYPPAQWRRSEIVGAAYQFRIPAAAPAGSYPLLLSVIDAGSDEYAGPATPLAQITVAAHERNFELPQNVTPLSAFIDDEIELVGYRLLDRTVAPRRSFGLTLYWRSLRPAETNYTVFVHAVGPDQVMRGQWDSQPVQGQAPTSGWLPGEIIEDHYDVPMAKDAPPWEYDIFVGM
ncbi:MAG: glycosyltransferase family 39 protein, partial [Chloroflexota bacterium]